MSPQSQRQDSISSLTSVLIELTGTINAVVSRLDKQDERMESIEKQLKSVSSSRSSVSSSSESGGGERQKIPLVVRVRDKIWIFISLLLLLLLFLYDSLKSVVYVVFYVMRIKRTFRDLIWNTGGFDSASHYMYGLCYIYYHRASFNDDSNKKVVQRMIREVQTSNPSFQAGQIRGLSLHVPIKTLHSVMLIEPTIYNPQIITFFLQLLHTHTTELLLRKLL